MIAQLCSSKGSWEESSSCFFQWLGIVGVPWLLTHDLLPQPSSVSLSFLLYFTVATRRTRAISCSFHLEISSTNIQFLNTQYWNTVCQSFCDFTARIAFSPVSSNLFLISFWDLIKNIFNIHTSPNIMFMNDICISRKIEAFLASFHSHVSPELLPFMSVSNQPSFQSNLGFSSNSGLVQSLPGIQFHNLFHHFRYWLQQHPTLSTKIYIRVVHFREWTYMTIGPGKCQVCRAGQQAQDIVSVLRQNFSSLEETSVFVLKALQLIG